MVIFLEFIGLKMLYDIKKQFCVANHLSYVPK